MFLFAGGRKLAGQQQMVDTFQAIGIGQWFRYRTGIIEVGGALLLFVPSLAFFGASALAVTMVGAVITHSGHRRQRGAGERAAARDRHDCVSAPGGALGRSLK
jgi:uncharacterized membrane protein YphA (DoxX/SURF4 family)